MFFFWGCVHSKNKAEKSIIKHEITDTASINQRLISVGYSFQPEYIDLNSSICADTSMTRLFQEVPLSSLRQQKNYDYFLTIILLKLYHFHLVQGHQGYDLISMKKEEASLLIDDFCSKAHVKPNIEMINSAYIMEYIKQRPTLIQDSYIIAIMDSITIIENEIKGILLDDGV